MSFETARALEVMKEFELTGLAGANISNPEELLRDPKFREALRTDKTTREFFAYLGGVKVKQFLRELLP